MAGLPYHDLPIPQTHPRALSRAARRWGLSPCEPSEARVLELGCAHGVNLMAMAARLPAATFVGVDRDAGAIVVANERAQRAGLTNVSFEAADIADYQPPSECFDYAIAHGVLSWVPTAVGEALFACMRSALGSQGIAYVSYDTPPGASLRDAIGHALRALDTADPRVLRAALEVFAESPALDQTHEGACLKAQIEAALEFPDAYLQQQFLSPHQRALSVSEVWDWAAEHGLHYVDDLAETGLTSLQVKATAQMLDAPDRRAHEQMLDVALHRRFRASVFTRSTAELERCSTPDEPTPPAVEVAEYPRVHPLARVEAEDLGFVSTRDHTHRPLHDLHRLLIQCLDGTHDIAALQTRVVDAVREGRLALPTAAGRPATVEEAQHGAHALVAAAVRELADEGVLLSD